MLRSYNAPGGPVVTVGRAGRTAAGTPARKPAKPAEIINLWEGSLTPKQLVQAEPLVVVTGIGVGDASHKRFRDCV
ncbi:hypothetical protein PLANPX_0980 [Lacipirellula parvula]|uniref:Uncharacterized protein n=1 Tax=Lacipirellula parvula TaxID=2650471 RepID=A0A5K7X447_9BACT|nr:hypothetical protein PLANPX_0980 [Lacipirellula parvula]